MFENLASTFSSLFSRLTGQSRITEKNIETIFQSLQDALLDADVPQEVADSFLRSVHTDVIGQKLTTNCIRPGEQFAKIVYDRLVTFLGGQQTVDFSFPIPSRAIVLGLQGAGKTTALAKFAYHALQHAQKRGKDRTILMASVDMYRPAAIDQLELLAQQVGANFYRSPHTDAIKATADILAYSKQHAYDILLLDTAGRLHIDELMLDELKKIVQIINPTHKFLVVDGMIGQESLTVAQSFLKTIGFDYALLTKMDSDSRGGAAFAFRYMLQKPILFIGTGEKAHDFEPFRPERIARRIIGMGDLQGLIEQAESKIKNHEKESLAQSFNKNKLTLNDFAKHLALVDRMGPLEGLMKQLPVFNGTSISPEMMQQGKKEMQCFLAIINSMTPKERVYPALLDKSRRQRIAKGAGVEPGAIKILLERFEKSQQFVKLFKKLGRLPGFG